MFKPSNSKTTTASASSQKSIISWFQISFLCFSIIFLLTLLPLIFYCRNVFTDLEIQKSSQQMTAGIAQLEDNVAGIVSAASSLSSDSRFLPFRYINPDYSSIPVSIRMQLKFHLNSLMFPLSLVSDSALHLSENIVVTPSITIFNETPEYYPFHFRVEGMEYEEWMALLEEQGSGFLPALQITVNGATTYDALIYSVPWGIDSYLYACMNISDIKQTLIAKSDLDTYFLTLSNLNGNCLYTDLPATMSDIHSISQTTSYGNLLVTIHIPKSILTEQMRPLYVFLGLYLTLCMLVLLITIYIGSRVTSKPVINILNLLSENGLPPAPLFPQKHGQQSSSPFQTGFLYIQNQVVSYKTNLNNYRDVITTQAKVLQSRFLEKALHGSLSTEADYEEFLSYFPDFPDRFCLVKLGILEMVSEKGTLYSDALSLIRLYLQNTLPHVYQQQLTNAELLLIIDEKHLEESTTILNYLLENINREEPCYHAWAIAGNVYHHPKNIPTAYWKIQDLCTSIPPDTISSLQMVSDFQHSKKIGFQMEDAPSLHSAITYGNKEIALLKLQGYSESLNAGDRSVFEMIRSILLCIKQENADLLSEQTLPPYRVGSNLYAILEEAISAFCDIFCQIKQQNPPDSFAGQVKEYIDAHFPEDDLCQTTLAEHFRCSPSKIHKAFTKEYDFTVSNYIEKQRMNLANDLLNKGEFTVVEIAAKCGFSSYNTFIKAYRRVFGHRPSDLK